MPVALTDEFADFTTRRSGFAGKTVAEALRIVNPPGRCVTYILRKDGDDTVRTRVGGDEVLLDGDHLIVTPRQND